jgi:hypothetical protein
MIAEQKDNKDEGKVIYNDDYRDVLWKVIFISLSIEALKFFNPNKVIDIIDLEKVVAVKTELFHNDQISSKGKRIADVCLQVPFLEKYNEFESLVIVIENQFSKCQNFSLRMYDTTMLAREAFPKSSILPFVLFTGDFLDDCIYQEGYPFVYLKYKYKFYAIKTIDISDKIKQNREFYYLVNSYKQMVLNKLNPDDRLSNYKNMVKLIDESDLDTTKKDTYKNLFLYNISNFQK